MKRRLLITAVAVLALSLAAYGTLAYLTGGATAHNVITAGNVKIELLDKPHVGDGEREDFPENGLQVMPGTTASKEVSVKNLENESWVRVKLVKEFAAEQEPADPDPEQEPAAADPLELSPVTLDLNVGDDPDEWTEGADGYYYYNSPLGKDAETSKLFTTVTFDPSMGNQYQNTVLTIQVYAEAVQTANNKPVGGATEADGWPAP